jgi:hypothetical protein
MRFRRLAFLALGTGAFCIAAASPSRATVVDIPAAKDNTIYQESINSNGAGEHIFAGTNNGGSVRRGLIQFNLAGYVPAGSTINSATLTLNLSQTVTGPINVTLHHVLQAWGEGASDATGGEGGGAPAAAGDATWVHTFYDLALWDNPGGDFLTDESASTIVNDLGSYSWSSAGMVADLQGWLNAPATNFGWMIRASEGDIRTAKRFDSRQSTVPGTQPLLRIDFTSVPEPGVLPLGALVFRLMPRRRRGRLI